jgi:hypothetical protein
MHSSSGMKQILVFIYAPVAALYLLLSYFYPTDPVTIARRHFSMGEARTMALILALTLICIWVLAFYASWMLKKYSQSIKDYKDGRAFYLLATGMQVLAIYLPIRSVSKIALNAFARSHPSTVDATNLIITYINVLLPLIAYIYLSRGGYKLYDFIGGKVPFKHSHILVVILCAIGVTYCAAVFTPSNILTPSDWLITVDYGISFPLRLFTIVLPFLYMWGMALIATYQIYYYQTKGKGIFYRRSLRLLSFGLALEVVTSIAIQYLNAISANVESFPTAAMFLLISIVATLSAMAFIMMVRGVKKLRLLENIA